ncbi:MAG: VOC family protein [Chloroflexi bacterium]|nr:VOC family protein [Chloroflexota bacterium]
MSNQQQSSIGSIVWTDLTVENADELRAFYSQVVGWQTSEVDMGDHSDFNMHTPASKNVVAGICHARGVNADLPAAWLIYITVNDLAQSAARCVELGGQVIAGPREAGDHGRYCVIRDPAGAVAALFEAAK